VRVSRFAPSCNHGLLVCVAQNPFRFDSSWKRCRGWVLGWDIWLCPSGVATRRCGTVERRDCLVNGRELVDQFPSLPFKHAHDLF
jgi:hypothetical protein